MSFAVGMVLWYGCCAIAPFIGGLAILIMSRIERMKSFSFAILFSGILFGILMIIVTFSNNSWIFESYVRKGYSIFVSYLFATFIAFYYGFGIGSIGATVVSIPWSLVSQWHNSSDDIEMDEEAEESK